MDNKRYLMELVKNGMWIFPIKGKGESIEECKKPMSFKEGDNIITWKNEKILTYSEELIRKGHQAWGLWLMKSSLFGIDLDLYKLNISTDRIVNDLKNSDLYIEKSGRGGVHVIGSYTGPPSTLMVKPDIQGIEGKHDGYFIIYPSILKTPENEYRYEKVNGDLLNLMDIELGVYVVENVLYKNGIEVKLYIERSRISSSVLKENIKINGLNLDLDHLSDKQITTLLYLLFKETNCKGMEKIMRNIYEEGICPVRKTMDNGMKINRTTRWMVQYILSSTMAWLGFSSDRTREWLLSWRFIDEDEDPRSDSLENSLLNVYKYNKLFLIPRGGCPFCTPSCSLSPMHRVLRVGERRVRKMVDIVTELVKS
ncbi:MAG: hypothetical protein QW607_06490 [Desulfurococcaceae archaeon]